jgi:hypothetical protein
MSTGESTASEAGRLLSLIPVPDPVVAFRTTASSCARAVDSSEIEEGGGGDGIPGTRRTARVGAKSRARLRNTLGASGVVESR